MVRRVVSPTARLVVRSHFSHLSWKVVVPCAISNPIRRISPHEPSFLSPSAQDLRMIAPHRASLSTRSPCSTPNSWIFGGHREQWPCHRNGPSAGEFSSKTAPPSQRVSTTHVQPDRERSDDDSLGPRLSSTRDRYHRSGRVKSAGPARTFGERRRRSGTVLPPIGNLSRNDAHLRERSRKLLCAGTARDHRVYPTSLTRRPDMKELKCSDVGMKTCNFVAQGRDEKEVMTKAAEHAKNAHGMTAIPP